MREEIELMWKNLKDLTDYVNSDIIEVQYQEREELKMEKNNFCFKELQPQLARINSFWSNLEEEIRRLEKKQVGKIEKVILLLYSQHIANRPESLAYNICIKNIRGFFCEDERQNYNQTLAEYTPQKEKSVSEEITKRLQDHFCGVLRLLSKPNGIQFYMESHEELMMLYLENGDIAFENMKFKFTLNVE